ncbi:hypothetical protein KCU73_g6957, partial [Aureobasidium melanogenum]
MTRDGLERAKSKLPENEDVTCALSYFTGPPGGAEVKKLVAAVTNNMCALGEIDDEDVLRRNAEPEVIEFEEGRDKSRAGDFRDWDTKPHLDKAIIANAKLWMTVCAQYEDVVDYAHQAVLADRRMFEAKEEMERRQKLDKLAKLQEELDELLEKADDNSLHIA